MVDFTGHLLRTINTAGEVTILAGQFGSSASTDGVGTNARFSFPVGIALDSNGVNLYVAVDGNGIRQVVVSSGVVTTVATGFVFQAIAIASSSNVLYVAEQGNMVSVITVSSGVRTLLAGMTTQGYIDGFGSNAAFSNCAGIALNILGTAVYVSDYNNNMIRYVVIGTQSVSTAAGAKPSGLVDGTGTAARFHSPVGLAISSSITGTAIFIADSDNQAIRMMVNGTCIVNFRFQMFSDVYCSFCDDSGRVTTVAGGNPTTGGIRDDFGTNAMFYGLKCLALTTNGYMYVSDFNANAIRKFDTTGYCPGGSYSIYGQDTMDCATVPAGYYQPPVLFSDSYYVCPAGYYTSGPGAMACSVCPSSVSFGTTVCHFPTGQPTSQPSQQPTRQPTRQPTSQPTSQPSGRPSSHPTSYCPPGTYHNSYGVCTAAPVGEIFV